MKYERPNLEEIELELEGSFLEVNTVGSNKNENGLGSGGDGNEDSPWG